MSAPREFTGRRRWARPELYVLHRLFACTPTAALAARLGRSYRSVAQQAHMMGISKSPEYRGALNARLGKAMSRASVAARFQKGAVPWNAGAKGWSPAGTHATRFKPGSVPPKFVPVGTTRQGRDGFERKVAATGIKRVDWRPLTEVIWTQHHGSVPRGAVIAFREGEQTTDASLITVDRLELITRAELMRRNDYRTRYPKEIAQLIQLRGALNRKINKAERDAKQNPRFAQSPVRRARGLERQGGTDGT